MTAQRASPSITEVAQYAGQTDVLIVATQLGSAYSPRRQRAIVEEWLDFFADGPSAITSLTFSSRTPKRLFDALRTQSQLRSLRVKWGDYDDLSVLATMSCLTNLSLGGAARVRDLWPLTSLISLEHLLVEDLVGTIDLSPVGELSSVTDLELGGSWTAPRRVHTPDIQFLRGMPALRRLVLHTMIVDDGDYAPLLVLPNLVEVRVAKSRRMRPGYEELRAQLPWSG